MPSKIFQEILDNVPKEIKKSVGRSMKIAAKIDELLKEKGLRQSDLAQMMNKSESEISKWLSGDHNFTIDTIDKIESALDAEIINIPLKSADAKSEKAPHSFRTLVYNPGRTSWQKTTIKATEVFEVVGAIKPIAKPTWIRWTHGNVEPFVVVQSESAGKFQTPENQWRQDDFNKNNHMLNIRAVAFSKKSSDTAS